MGNNTLEDIHEANGSLTSLSLKANPEGSSLLVLISVSLMQIRMSSLHCLRLVWARRSN